MRPSMRDHSSMRRAPSISSASVGMRTTASVGSSVGVPSLKEKYPSRQPMTSNTTSSIWKRTWRSRPPRVSPSASSTSRSKRSCSRSWAGEVPFTPAHDLEHDLFDLEADLALELTRGERAERNEDLAEPAPVALALLHV